MRNATADGTHVKKVQDCIEVEVIFILFSKKHDTANADMWLTSSKMYVSKYSGNWHLTFTSSSSFLFTRDNALGFG